MRNKGIISQNDAMTKVYEKVYGIIGDLTPIKADCGKLCNKACCKGDTETGMYLFPFEELMMKGTDDWLNISKSEFNYTLDRYADIAVCKKACPRDLRPLSCRIFPLAFYVDKDNNFSVQMDKRASSMCPLAFSLTIDELDSDFVKAVHKAGEYLMNFRIIARFIKSQSRLIDEFEIFTNLIKNS